MRYVMLAVFAALTLPANAQLYRWTDAQGKTHFTDTPPPATARTAKDVRRTGGASAASDAAAVPNEPFVLQEARRKFPVKLYSTPDCEPCDEARKLLNARGVPFTEVSVADPESAADFKKTIGGTSVPALMVGGTVQTSFEQGRYHRALDAAGYPRQGILPSRNQAEPTPAQTAEEPQPEEPAARGPYAPRR